METKELTTPVGGQVVVLKTAITGRERRSLRNVLLKDMQVNPTDTSSMQISGAVIEQAEDMALQTFVVSIDGDTTDVLNKVLDMASDDYEFIVAEVNKLSAEKEKKS